MDISPGPKVPSFDFTLEVIATYTFAFPTPKDFYFLVGTSTSVLLEV